MIAGKHIAITGTTKGIGQSLYLQLRSSNTVSTLNRPEYDLENLDTLSKLDFSNVDLLILNAGHLLGGKTLFKDHAVADWTKVISANLTGNLFLLQRYIQQRQQGCVVVLSSMRAARLTSDLLVYSSAKTALSMAVSNLRLELAQLGQDIRLIDVKPAYTNATGQPDSMGRKAASYQQVASVIINTIANSNLEEIRF